MECWRREWAAKKTEIARRLECGECEGSYAEAVLILCAVISALAAELWPRTHVDKKRFDGKRFAEAIMRASAGSNGDWVRISVPLLIQWLRDKTRVEEAKALEKEYVPYQSGRILLGDEVDRTEEEILQVCPDLNRKEIRNYSYPRVLYREVRSSYVHEYRAGDESGSVPMARKRSPMVGYVNRTGPTRRVTKRLVHFHVESLCRLAESAAGWAASKSEKVPLGKPGKWRVDG